MDDSSRAVYLLDKQIIEGSRKSPLLLEISGNSQTILNQWQKGMERGDYKYLKINVSGAGVQSFGSCLFYTILALTVLFFFPVFILASNCIKRRLYMLFRINLDVYKAIASIITTINPRECYVVIQDNFFNQAKSNLLLEALQRTEVNKFELVNIAKGLDL
jgi:hypothetical protein